MARKKKVQADELSELDSAYEKWLASRPQEKRNPLPC